MPCGSAWYSRGVEEACYLIEVLLPLSDNEGHRFGDAVFAETRRELTDRFGGLTAHLQAPARGLWKTDEGHVDRDDIVIFEVMAAGLDRDWWRHYRGTLERRFQQEVVVVRATAITTL